MKLFLTHLLLFFSILLEATVIQLPIVLLVLLTVAVIYREEWIFPVALVSGVILDALLFRTLGSSSVFFLLVLFLVFLYEKKFELRTIWFVVFISAIGSFIFLVIFGYVNILFQTVLSIALSVLLFFLFSVWNPKPGKDILTTWKK